MQFKHFFAFRILRNANMTLHIIHLNHRIDRLAHVANQLEYQNITNFRIWEGFYDQEKPSRGIAKAHQQIDTWAMDQLAEDVLVAEDDVEFAGKNSFSYFLQNEPTIYDLAGRGKYFVCNPMVALQIDGFSDNINEYRNNKGFFEKRNLWMG
jgi:hypothetical protein